MLLTRTNKMYVVNVIYDGAITGIASEARIQPEWADVYTNWEYFTSNFYTGTEFDN